ncbi:MAG: ABC transporter ATP-binding protein/permease [Bacteroidales bacterium]|nr:ABC transporter ATP-binding protein/permease [Bacteroidales bacterium]MCM1416277.1 ABC transporter ATP-binding protein/permease [bacterium]MCM1423474.1 ABC transporter ATP-binding protein/permease [bacterium]
MAETKEKTGNVVGKTLAYFMPIAWKHYKGFFFCGAFNTILRAVQPFVSILMTPLILDELLGGRDLRKLFAYAAAIAVGGTFLSLLISITDVVMEKYSEKMENYFTEEMSLRVMELDFQLTEDKEALDQIEKARTGMDWYSGGVHGISLQVFQFISNVIKIIGVVALILLHAPVLFAVTAFLLVINTVLNHKGNLIEIEAFNRLSKSNRAFSYLAFHLVDFRYGKDIRLYDAKDMMVEKWNAYTNDALGNWKWEADQHLPLNSMNTVCDAVRDFCTYLYLGTLVITGKITIGIFSQMLSAGSTFHSSMQGLILNVQELVKRTNYAYEYVKFMNYPPAIAKGEHPVEEKPHTIEFRNVSFTYPHTDVKVLDGVNLTLHPGEHLSVVGLNGAGKTTFIKLLCRLYDPTEGEILLDGVNIKDYAYDEYMALFSPVFQDFKLLAFSIRDNILLDHACDEAELDTLIEQTGLKEKTDSLEKGTDTMLFKFFDEDGIEPSGGEQQKIAIARALFKKSPIVILDEPTAALDPVAEYDIYRQFDSLVGKKTAVYISHRLSSCKFCDRIAVFSEGRIREYGTHDELVGVSGGIYAEMFAAQAQYYN